MGTTLREALKKAGLKESKESKKIRKNLESFKKQEESKNKEE